MKIKQYKIKPERASHMNHDLRTILVKADSNHNRHHLITMLTPLGMDADQFMQCKRSGKHVSSLLKPSRSIR